MQKIYLEIYVYEGDKYDKTIYKINALFVMKGFKIQDVC